MPGGHAPWRGLDVVSRMTQAYDAVGRGILALELGHIDLWVAS